MNSNWLYEKWKLIPIRSKIGRALYYLFLAWLAYLGIKNTIRDGSVSSAFYVLGGILILHFIYRKKWHDFRRTPPKLWTEDWLYEKWNLIPLRSRIGRVAYFMINFAFIIWVVINGINEFTSGKNVQFQTILLISTIGGHFIRRSDWRAKQNSTMPTPKDPA